MNWEYYSRPPTPTHPLNELLFSQHLVSYITKYPMDGASQDEMGCARVCGTGRYDKALLLGKGEALLGNVLASPSNWVVCVCMRACVRRWTTSYEESVFLGGVPGEGGESVEDYLQGEGGGRFRGRGE